MYILSQNNDGIYDTEKSCGIYARDEYVYAMNVSGEISFLLGKYKDETRALEIVAEIFTLLDCDSKYEMPVV